MYCKNHGMMNQLVIEGCPLCTIADQTAEIERLQARVEALENLASHVAYYSLDNMPEDVRNAAHLLLQQESE